MTDEWGDACGFSGNVAPGDFNQDGIADLLIPTDCLSGDTYGTVEFFRGDDTGHFTHNVVASSNGDYNLITKDVNQDGKLDAVFFSRGVQPYSWNSGFGVLLNQGAGQFSQTLEATGYGIAACAGGSSVNGGGFGDFNGDGTKDEILDFTNYDFNSCSQGATQLSFYAGNQNGNYSTPQTIGSIAGGGIVTGDFNRDGRLDFAMTVTDPTNQTGHSLVVYLNRTSTAPTCAAPTAKRAVSLCILPASNSAHVLANTTDSRLVAAMKVYVDGVSSFYTPDDIVNRVLSLSAGTHRITAKAWDTLGTFSTTQYVTIGESGTSCSNSTDRTVLICSPQNGTTESNPVTVQAAVATSLKFYSARIYVDGASIYQTASKDVDTSLTLSSGTHKITVKAWDSSGSFSQSVWITVH